MASKGVSRLIRIQDGVIGPVEPRKKTVQAKTRGDYPGVSPAHLDIAEVYASPKLAGPPLCDELIALMVHTFTEEEASIARHIGPRARETAATVAAAAHRPVEEVQPILERLANEKCVLLAFGSGENRMYTNLPLAAGTFEMVLMRTSLETLTDWHRRFCELFAALYETGFGTDYWGKRPPAVKYLPMGQVIASHPMAYPSDKLEEVFDRYDSFGVTLCQCRIVEEMVGRGCGKPKEVCLALGISADRLIQAGKFRRIERKEALEIKAEAEAQGLVTWITSLDPKWGGSSCSCCGDCCHMMRIISEFNMPGIVAPPHFLPRLDVSKCTYCGKCALACPMGAVTVDTRNKTYRHDPRRCIGCAQCVVACNPFQAVVMEAVPEVEDFKQDRSRGLMA